MEGEVVPMAKLDVMANARPIYLQAHKGSSARDVLQNLGAQR